MLHVHRGLVIPACMRKELMSLAHATHIDIEGCLRRVRECFFGVGLRLMSKKMFSSVTCDRTSQVKELVLQHEVIETMAQGSRRRV